MMMIMMMACYYIALYVGVFWCCLLWRQLNILVLLVSKFATNHGHVLCPLLKMCAICACSCESGRGRLPAGFSGCAPDQSVVTLGLFLKRGVCRPCWTEKLWRTVSFVASRNKPAARVRCQTSWWRTDHVPKRVACHKNVNSSYQ